MTDRELLQQALDALISVWNMDKTTKQVETIQAIKARLAQQNKEWVGLTDEERNACLVEADPCEALLEHEAWQLMVDIEAKLKEKNT